MPADKSNSATEAEVQNLKAREKALVEAIEKRKKEGNDPSVATKEVHLAGVRSEIRRLTKN